MLVLVKPPVKGKIKVAQNYHLHPFHGRIFGSIMLHKLNNYVRRFLMRHGHEKKISWILYTVLFGMMPIFIRLIYYFVRTDNAISWYSIPDIAFFGIMINTATVGKMISDQSLHRNFISTAIAICIFHVIVFMSIHSMGIYQSSPNLFALALCLFFVASSLMWSFSVSDDNILRQWNDDFRIAQELSTEDSLIKKDVLDFYDNLYSGKPISFYKTDIPQGHPVIRGLKKEGYIFDSEDNEGIETWVKK